MVRIQLVIILLLLQHAGVSYGQQKISGKVFELNTSKALSNCTIRPEKGKGGTISNEDGEFELVVSNSEKKFYISHIGYKKELIEIRNNNIGVFLEPVSIPLKEVVAGNPALAFLNRALGKSSADSLTRKYFKGYLRSTLTQDSKLTSFNEILFDAEWGSKGIKNWKPNQNRYAIEDDALYKSQSIFNFFSSFVKTGTIIKSKILPNGLETDRKKYVFKIIKSYPMPNAGDIVEIQCIPKVKKKPFCEGSITINTTTDNILKIEGIYYQEKSEKNIAKNQTYEYEVNFSENRKGELIFENFRMTTKAKVKLNNIVENTLIYKIEEYPSGIKGLTHIRKSHDNLIQRPYIESFWKDNKVVKYTAPQQRFIDNNKRFVSNILK